MFDAFLLDLITSSVLEELSALELSARSNLSDVISGSVLEELSAQELSAHRLSAKRQLSAAKSSVLGLSAQSAQC